MQSEHKGMISTRQHPDKDDADPEVTFKMILPGATMAVGLKLLTRTHAT